MSTDEPVASTEKRTTRSRARKPPKWLWVVVILIVLVGALIQGTEILGDHGLANVLTALLGFIAVVTTAVWFMFFSGYRWRTRLLVLAGGLVGLGLLVSLVRIERFSGEMTPYLASRFAAEPDRLLPMPKPDAAANVDLRTTTADDFPQFLGPQRSESVESVRLARDWTTRPPKRVWRQPIGAGWSAFAAVNGHAVTMEQRGDLEMVTCYNVKTGRLEWATSWSVRYEKIEAGVGPRSTPTIDEGRVYALGAMGHLVCLDGASGKPIWQKDLLREFGVSRDEEANAVPWGRAASPLIVGDRVIVPAGGRKGQRMVSLVAYDKRRGTPIWQAGDEQISYSSPVLATLAGIEQVLIVNEASVGGYDVQSGRTLWTYPRPAHSNRDPNVSQAVPVPPNGVFTSKGYGLGGILIGLEPKQDGTLAPHEVWQDRKVMKTKFSNITVRDAYAYALSDGILECIELATGQTKWKQGRYGHGQVLRVNDLLLVETEAGEILLVEAVPDRPNHVLGRFQAVEGLTWNTLALYGPYLLVRNAEEAACYELPLEGRPSASRRDSRLWSTGKSTAESRTLSR